jgi:hypothetical protein
MEVIHQHLPALSDLRTGKGCFRGQLGRTPCLSHCSTNDSTQIWLSLASLNPYNVRTNTFLWSWNWKDVVITDTEHSKLRVMYESIWNNLNYQTYRSSNDLWFVTQLPPPLPFLRNATTNPTARLITQLNVADGVTEDERNKQRSAC